MITYTYIVKCPECEEEFFDFFDEAKEFALGCLSKKPIITQTEVNRNDFGECTDHCDLGTVWSWEDMMSGDAVVDATHCKNIFTRDDLTRMANGQDPEFDNIDNSVDFEPETSEVSALDGISDNFRKPIPEGMTLEQLVEEMEENEDTVECTWCNDLFDKSECRKEVDLGWLCSRCEMAIKSRGETLTFREGNYWDFLDESVVVDSSNIGRHIRLVYKDSKYHTDGDEFQLVDIKRLFKRSTSADLSPTGINLIVKFDNNCKVIQETDNAYLVIVPCYYRNQLDRSKIEEYPNYVRCWVPKVYAEFVEESTDNDHNEETKVLHDLGNTYDGGYPVEESPVETSRLEELEEAADYRNRLVFCPECGIEQAFDKDTGICLECGFNVQ